MAYYVRLEYPKIQAFTDNGLLMVGGKVYTYDAGTDTPVTTYSERTLSTPNANPVVLNARGEADIFTARAVKLVLKTSAGVQVWEQDYVGEQQTVFYSGSSVTTGNVAVVTGTPTAAALSANMMLVYTPDADNVDTMGATGSVVAGPNDCIFSGPYTGSTSSTFRVEIDDDSADPETFKWRKDVEAWTTGVSITGLSQTLKEGISVNFAVLTGHTTGDYWTLAVEPPYKINLDGLGAKLAYKNSGGTFIPLESGDVKSGYPSLWIYSPNPLDIWILTNTADYIASAESVTSRVRYEKTYDHTLTSDDHGNEISFIAAVDRILALPAAASLADKFFYISANGSGDVIITADGTELIKSTRKTEGEGTYVMMGSHNHVVQIATNGVDWHIMTETIGTIKRTVFTSSGTFIKDHDTKIVRSQGVSGGGGGGRSDSDGTPGGGGQGGGYFDKIILGFDVGATETVTVGAGGPGSVGVGAGTNGGTTSFGSHCSASGGVAGNTGSGGSGGGAGTGGDINIVGQPGSCFFGSTIYDQSGGAAGGPLGGSERKLLTTAHTAGTNGIDFGGGGSGGWYDDGGDGANGIVVVTEYK